MVVIRGCRFSDEAQRHQRNTPDGTRMKCVVQRIPMPKLRFSLSGDFP
jgi:hypothetical protein